MSAHRESCLSLSLQQLVGAAERLRGRDGDGPDSHDWLALVEEARDRLASVPFVALPLTVFQQKVRDKVRTLVKRPPVDRLIEQALLPIVTAGLESRLRDSVHGYRKGRSTFTAGLAASQALAGGQCWVTLLDVADCYPSVCRESLLDRLPELIGPEAAALVTALMRAPVPVDAPDPGGLPQGLALSPTLLNAYLLPVDDAMADHRATYLRFGDDVFLAAATSDERANAEAILVETLAALGLMLRTEKTQHILFEGSPIVYLGNAVDAHGVYERLSSRRMQRMLDGKKGSRSTEIPAKNVQMPLPRRQTLYVTEPGRYLHMANGLLVIRRGKEVVDEIPLHRVDRVLVLAGVSMSSAFLSTCVSRHVPVLFFVGKGRAYGSLVSGGMPNPLRLRAQYDLLAEPRRRTLLAQSIVEAKIQAMIRRLYRVTAAGKTRQALRGIVEKLPQASGPEQLRGYEGAATRAYYEMMPYRLRVSGFEFTGRSKRPPLDAINSLLSFSYSLIFGEMQTALLARGLDPYPAVLHNLHRNHPALASDLIEPYRVLIADSFTLGLVNQKQVHSDGFETRARNAVYMTPETRKTVLHAYETFMDRPTGGGKGAGTPRGLIELAARAMLSVVLGEVDRLELPLIVGVDANGDELENE